MRLLSAIYEEYYPYDGIFTDCFTSRDVDDVQYCDALVVWGGEDISPALYNKGRSSMSGAGGKPSMRDHIEWSMMQEAVKHKKLILGVCRGAQMLCALAGGSLYQHCDGHAGRNHAVETFDGKTFNVNSVHHQMMNVSGTEHELVAWSTAVGRNFYDVDPCAAPVREPEFVWFPTVRGFAMQNHNEWMDLGSPAVHYCLDFIKEKMSAAACV